MILFFRASAEVYSDYMSKEGGGENIVRFTSIPIPTDASAIRGSAEIVSINEARRNLGTNREISSLEKQLDDEQQKKVAENRRSAEAYRKAFDRERDAARIEAGQFLEKYGFILSRTMKLASEGGRTILWSERSAAGNNPSLDARNALVHLYDAKSDARRAEYTKYLKSFLKLLVPDIAGMNISARGTVYLKWKQKQQTKA